MLDIEGLSSNIFEPEPELVNDWNKQHKDYQLYISPITFEQRQDKPISLFFV